MRLPTGRVGAALVVAALLGGCASGDRSAAPAPAASTRPAPAWLEVMPSAPGMLYAVGSAPAGDRERAVAAARAELASEIEVSVEAEHTQREASTSAADSTGNRTERYDREVRSLARSRVAQRSLPGVMVRETYDTADRSWVLVAMDRSAWAAQLRAQIDALDARLAQARGDHERAQPDQAQPTAAMARYYQQIAPLVSERAELETRHRLAGGETIPPPPVDVDRVRIELSDDLRLMGIRIAVADRTAATMAPLARDACARQGLRVEDASPELELDLSLAPRVERIGSEFRADGTLVATLVTTDAHRTLAEFTLDERASGLDAAAARQRLLEKLADAVAKRLDEQLVSFVARW